ncbi:potassium-transporting ATPase subunit KdpA [Campylobacter jejuni]
MLPLSFILAVIFISEGVVQNYHANFSVLTLENKFQSIATGPVAALESIKHLGTNGGGGFLVLIQACLLKILLHLQIFCKFYP